MCLLLDITISSYSLFLPSILSDTFRTTEPPDYSQCILTDKNYHKSLTKVTCYIYNLFKWN